MGYTHYFSSKRTLSRQQWARVNADVGEIMAAAYNLPPGQRVFLVGPMGVSKTKVLRTDDEIAFNAIGKAGCETFCISRHPYQDYCKTARLRYDVVVTACLCYLESTVPGFRVSSDGNGVDFLEGLDLAKKALPHLTDKLDIPRSIMEADRWIWPYVRLETEKYAFDFCVDGCAYITSPRAKRYYRFPSHLEAAWWIIDHLESFKAQGPLFKARVAIANHQNHKLSALLRDASAQDRAIAPPEICRPEERMLAERRFPHAYNAADLVARVESQRRAP
jgi:hypothetical protein